LEETLRGKGIQTLILWKYKPELSQEGYRYESAYLVLATIDGAAFWSYFPNPMVIPGPNVCITGAKQSASHSDTACL
jgi:hypothetical protein